MGDDDDSWIYDSVVGFLNSPIWMVPIESFVDQHCLVFDGITDENPEYISIHAQYKALVEELLESFTKDLHITSAQFIGGCQKGRAATSSYTQGMFEYVFASVNYGLFKSIMVRHNAALSLQALQMIRGGSNEGTKDLEEEVMKFSQHDYQSQREEFDAKNVKEMADLEAALVKSRLDCETLLKSIEKDKITLEEELHEKIVPKPSAPEELYPAIPDFVIEPVETTPATTVNTDPESSLPPLRVVPPPQSVGSNAAAQWMEEAKAEHSGAHNVTVQEEQTLEERRRYWQQRKQDIVEAKKKQAMQTLTAHGGTASRPKSACVAQRAIEETAAVAAPVTAEPLPARPAMSQALAEALKREVLHRTD